MNLIDMVSSGSLSSTGYVLTNPGKECLVLLPNETDDGFDLEVVRGACTVEWYSVTTRETRAGSDLKVEKDGRVRFAPPFAAGPAVLYLKVAT